MSRTRTVLLTVLTATLALSVVAVVVAAPWRSSAPKDDSLRGPAEPYG